MIRFLLGLALSVAVTNWVYEEMAMYDDGLKQALDDISSTLRIPTHNNWFEGEGREVLSSVSESVDNFGANMGNIGDWSIFHVTDRISNIRRLVTVKRSGQRVENRAPQPKLYEMVSDDEMFIQRL